MKKHLIVGVLLIALFSVVFSFAVYAAQQRGLLDYKSVGWLYSDVELANRAFITGKLPETAFYPPLMMLVMLALFHAGFVAINMAIFNGCVMFAGFIGLYVILYRLLRSTSLAGGGVAIAVVNPYVVWTFLINKDTASEFLLMTVTVGAVLSAWERGDIYGAERLRWDVARAVGFCTLMMLNRTTGFFVALGLLLTAVFLSRTNPVRRKWGIATVVFLTIAAVFCFYNKLRVGRFTLSTSSGCNLYLGNHPNYLDGHPKYDIDVFLPGPTGLPSNGEVAQDDVYRRVALGYILGDPAAFIYRLIVKSEWYWIGAEKIPNYLALTTLDYSNQTIHIGKIDSKPGLVFIIYRMIYMPFFYLSLFLIWKGELNRKFIFLIVPMIAIWPIAILTFPDTRFKLNAELMMMPAVIAAWKTRRIQDFILRRGSRWNLSRTQEGSEV